MATKTAYARAWGAEIRSRRELLKLSRRDLAEMVEVTPTMVGYWEQGRHAPSPRMQTVLVQTLGIDPVTMGSLILKGGGAEGNGGDRPAA